MRRIIFPLLAFLVIGFALPVTSSPEFPDKYVAGHLIVQFRPEYRGQINVSYQDGIVMIGISSVDELNKSFKANRIDKAYRNPNPNENAKRFGIDLIYLLVFPEQTKMVDLINAYQACPAIQHADPNYVIPVDFEPNDPIYPNQWHHKNLQCERGWDVSQGDTMVWIAIIDQGLQWDHPDIIDNVWINHPEDINNNGRFDTLPYPDGDINGADEDANGFVDDVIGWDFYYWDNNPKNETGDESHGTLCFGTACAVTNNSLGVASFGFNARGAGLRCGDNTGIYTYASIQAITYAADNGAFAISMSYGGTGYVQEVNNALQYAWSMGCVLMASAGNTYSGGSPRYPACYDHVIATAASDRFDRRSIWYGGEESNYADWVDVVAPGTDVYTTTTGNGYDGQFGGTSAASPCVGGLAILLKSAYPSMTNADCTTRIFQSCDSMSDSTYRLGLLGNGRINVGKALNQPIRCFLQLTDYRIVDRSGNNNGYPDLGETCAVVITLSNDPYWQTATGVSITASTGDTTITFIQPTGTFPDIPDGEARSCSADSIIFVTHSNAVPHRLSLALTKNSTPESYDLDEHIKFPIGAPRVILVDDDDGMSIEQWYIQACDSLGVLYKYWSVYSSGSPSLDTLNHYPVVVWFTGLDSTQTLTSSDMTTLSSYLDGGGNLFLCGQNLGQGIGTEIFYAERLHTRYISNRITTGSIARVFGINGDPIGYSEGDTLVLMGPGGAGNAHSMDGIAPLSGAEGSHHYATNPDSIYGGTHYAGTYKVVYFGFPLEAIAGNPARYTQKWQIFARILNFFGEQLPPIAVKESDTPPITHLPISLTLSFTPNPFNKQIAIRWQKAEMLNAQLRIYDASGKLVKAFTNINSPAIIWDGKDSKNQVLPNGVYFCEIQNENIKASGKVLMLK